MDTVRQESSSASVRDRDVPVKKAATPQVESRPSFESQLIEALPRAYRTALHLTGEPADAEDIVQQAVLQALRRYELFQPGTNFSAWFTRIVTNVFRMERRRARVRPSGVPLDSASELFLYRRMNVADMDSEAAGPARSFVSKLDTEKIISAIGALPVEFREVASLYFVDDLSYQQMAEVLECPVGTVRSRLHRARKLLQRALWEVAEEHGLV